MSTRGWLCSKVSDTEVAHEDAVVFHEEYILALEISVNHMILMDDLERQHDLCSRIHANFSWR